MVRASCRQLRSYGKASVLVQLESTEVPNRTRRPQIDAFFIQRSDPERGAPIAAADSWCAHSSMKHSFGLLRGRWISWSKSIPILPFEQPPSPIVTETLTFVRLLVYPSAAATTTS